MVDKKIKNAASRTSEMSWKENSLLINVLCWFTEKYVKTIITKLNTYSNSFIMRYQ